MKEIDENQKNIVNSGDPTTVRTGETILIRATVDRSGLGMFMEFGSIIQKRNDIRGIFNKHRKNGYVPGLRRAWEPTTMEDIKDNLGVDLLKIVFGKPVHTFLKHDLPEYIVDQTVILGDEPELQKDTEMEGSFLD